MRIILGINLGMTAQTNTQSINVIPPELKLLSGSHVGNWED